MRPTCGESSYSLTGLSRVETVAASEQRANPALQHAVPLSFHLAACVSITHTWDKHDNYSVSCFNKDLIRETNAETRT